MARGKNAPTISARIIWMMIDFGVARGLDKEELVQIVGRDLAFSSPDPDLFVPVTLADTLLANLASRLDDPGLPIQLAQAIPIESYHVLGFAVMTCMKAREALQRMMRLARLITNSRTWDVDLGDDAVTVTTSRSGELSLGNRLSTEYVIAALVYQYRALFAQEVDPLSVTFVHHAPRDLAAHRAFFRCPIRFDAESNSCTMPGWSLDSRSPAANPALSAFFSNYASSLLDDDQQPGSTTAAVRDVVSRELASGVPAATTVARQLALSERSLRRKLEAEQTSYREVVERVRRRRAEELLRVGTTAVAEVAFLLGFSDVSSFTRAFKRWTGMTPQTYRSRHARAGQQ